MKKFGKDLENICAIVMSTTEKASKEIYKALEQNKERVLLQHFQKRMKKDIKGIMEKIR